MVTNTATLVFLSDNCNAVKDAQGRNIELLCNCSFLGRDILFVEEYDALGIHNTNLSDVDLVKQKLLTVWPITLLT